MNRQYWTVANAVTVARLGIFGVCLFYLFRAEFVPALIAFAFAWGLDAIDGVIARQLRQASEFGSVLDKAIDRIIIGIGILAFIRVGYLPPEAILIGTKDIALLPSLTIHAARGENSPGLGWGGKAMTALQGAAVIWLLMNWPYQHIIVGITAIVGGLVAFRYLRAIV